MGEKSRCSLTTAPVVHGQGKILDGGMVGPHAGDMIGETAHGRCTDLPPVRKLPYAKCARALQGAGVQNAGPYLIF